MHDLQSLGSGGVLFVWRGFGRSGGGGVERFLVQSLTYLRDFGLEPYIFDLSGGSKPFGPEFDRFSDRIIEGPLLSIWPGETKFDLSQTWARLEELDIRLAAFNEPAHLAKMAYLPNELPVVLVCHSDPPSLDYYKTIKRFSSRINGFVCVSEVIAVKLRETLGPIRSAEIRKIRMGIDRICHERDRSKTDVFRIVYLGRLENESKRIMDIVPFVETLEALKINYTFSIIGDGDKKHLLKNELDRLNVGERARLLGRLSHVEAMKRLSQADALVLFSQYEGLPFSVLEALSYSVVPVVTRIESGFSEILINNENARLFDIGQPTQAAHIIKSLFDDPELLSRLQRAAGATAGRFRVEETIKAFSDLFCKVAKANPISTEDWNWRRAWRLRVWLTLKESSLWRIVGRTWRVLPASFRRNLRLVLAARISHVDKSTRTALE